MSKAYETMSKAIQNVPEDLREKIRFKFTFQDIMSFSMALGADDMNSLGVIIKRTAYSEEPLDGKDTGNGVQG